MELRLGGFLHGVGGVEKGTYDLDPEFVFFEIGDDCVDLQAAFHCAGPQNFDGRRGAVYSCDFPPMFRKPESVLARSAGEVQSFARRPRRRDFHEERRGRGVQIFRGAFAQAVAFIPIVNFHGLHCKSLK